MHNVGNWGGGKSYGEKGNLPSFMKATPSPSIRDNTIKSSPLKHKKEITGGPHKRRWRANRGTGLCCKGGQPEQSVLAKASQMISEQTDIMGVGASKHLPDNREPGSHLRQPTSQISNRGGPSKRFWTRDLGKVIKEHQSLPIRHDVQGKSNHKLQSQIGAAKRDEQVKKKKSFKYEMTGTTLLTEMINTKN